MKRSGPLRRSTVLRARSRKRAALEVIRRRAKAQLFVEHPICEVPWCDRASEDAHEPLTRARGGSITDLANMRAVCRLHHDLIHLEPDWAYELGFLRHSWEESA